ncbi:MAG: hypothetical protein WCH99_10870 [Verrucomicrobiota bacterium]
MNGLPIGVLILLVAASTSFAATNAFQPPSHFAAKTTADAVAQELRDVMAGDDAAQEEVSGWLHAFETQPAAGKTKENSAELTRRIRERFDRVRERYNKFLKNYPDYARGYLAFGSFLNEIGDEDGAKAQFENSKQHDPKNPAVWNNLANYYGEHGQLVNAFAHYAQAIKLKPDEPVYYRNLATTIYLFRKDAREFFHLDEQEVFDKALGLYQKAIQLAPGDFVLATDYAESYYGIKPLRTQAALIAWTNALAIAHTDAEREGVQLHLARVKIVAGFSAEAQAHLDLVSNPLYLDLKKRLARSLAETKKTSKNTVVETDTNPLIAMTNRTVAATNIVSTIISLPATSSNLPVTPPILREPKTP